MSVEREKITCVISGSFTKAKDRIDIAINTFEDGGIKVLSPQKGGLYYPPSGRLWTPGSYALAGELYLTEKQAKDLHLAAITWADFLYIVDVNGYMGTSVILEWAAALALYKPVYVQEPIDPNLDQDPRWTKYIEYVQVKSPEEVVKIWKDKKSLFY